MNLKWEGHYHDVLYPLSDPICMCMLSQLPFFEGYDRVMEILVKKYPSANRGEEFCSFVRGLFSLLTVNHNIALCHRKAAIKDVTETPIFTKFINE